MSSKKLLFCKKTANPYLANLVAYWKFDSNSNDFSGNGHNGADTNISYSNVGEVGNSATFNGTTSSMTVPQSTAFDFSDASNDISFTIMFGGYITGRFSQQFICKWNGSSAQWIIQEYGTKLYVQFFQNGSIYIGRATPNNRLPLNTWFNIAVTYDGLSTDSGIKIYIDGVLETTGTDSSGAYTKMATISTPLGIGNQSNGSSERLNGRMDEAYVWKNRVLDAAEILNASNEFFAGNPLI